MPEKSKIATYIGFSIKSRNVLYGYEQVIASHKKVWLILLDEEMGESSRKKVIAFAERGGIGAYFLPTGDLSAYGGGKNVKCIGLTDKNLASAAEKELITNIGGSN